MSSVFQKKTCSSAKINLHLAVGEKRADGFHDIESIFVPVSLRDHIDCLVSRSTAFSVTIRGMEGSGQVGISGDIPLEQNLMYRAALLFHHTTRLAFSLRIVIEKNIPQGAGLGGGSSNAAAVLGVLNEAAGFPLSHDAFMEAAARLGSDVPFFVKGKAAFITGRGEKVAPFDLARDLFFVLVTPAFASGTAEAYRLLDERRSVSRELVPQESVSPETLIAALEKPPSAWPYRNDFQSVFLDDLYTHSGACSTSSYKISMCRERGVHDTFGGGKRPVGGGAEGVDRSEGSAKRAATSPIQPSISLGETYRELFSSLQETGAGFTLLSGSGSTVFGVYESVDAAEAAVEGLSGRHWRSQQLETRPPLVRSCAAIRCS
ncbi:MAG: 4-(cytidine 5'-diphospho)-2-C-methyl-D-erythritol kinase [Spirochaetaceae bacterium]|nr:4-(cytidine 5'-diphospho)-2-C-methyl-D-erythritol kinase [Spirochaetaceae bacterium]